MIVAILKIVAGFALLIGGADLLVRGAASLALRIGISALVVGLTVVAFGTSSPELVVTVQAALTDRGAVAMGTVVGSNICNIVLILGLSALLRPIETHRDVLRTDLPIMILVSIVFTFVVIVSDTLTRLHGAVLFLGIVTYTVVTILRARREQAKMAALVDQEELPSSVPTRLMVVFLIAGPTLLVVGSRLTLDGSVTVAMNLGVSQAVIGLTLVAVGGSLPELATSIAAAAKGKADIAAGNIIGSNLFNILCILGVASLARPIPLRGEDMISMVDLAVMNITAVLLFPMMWTERRLCRREGAMMLAAYVGYVVYLFLRG